MTYRIGAFSRMSEHTLRYYEKERLIVHKQYSLLYRGRPFMDRVYFAYERDWDELTRLKALFRTTSHGRYRG